MFRTAVSILIGLVLTSSAAGEPIRVTSASATYWSQSEEFEFRLSYNRPLDFANGDYISFSGWLPADWMGGPRDEAFHFRSDQVTTPGTIDVVHVTYTPTGGIATQELRGALAYEINDQLFSATVPFSLLGIESPVFAFETAASGFGQNAVILTGLSHIDQRVTYVPEPATLVTAATSAIWIGWHWRRRRQRK